MKETRITVSEAIGDAADFARAAWRDAWLSMLICTAGWAAIVVADRAALTEDQASLLMRLGWCLLIFHLPLIGALYRSALGGRVARGLGPGGVQLGAVEVRLVAVNLLLAFAFVLSAAPATMISAALYVALRRFDGASLGPLGHFEWWFIAASGAWAALFIFLIYAAGRLACSTPQSLETRRLALFDGWPATAGEGWTIARAYILAHIPLAAALLALTAVGLIEPEDVAVGLHGPWPLVDAAGAGVVFGVLLTVVQAPMSVGLITFFYDVLQPVEEDEAVPAFPEDALAAAAVGEDPASEPESEPEPEPELEPEPDIEPVFSSIDFSPDTGRFFRVSAPWLADEPTPSPYDRVRWADPEPPAPQQEAEPPAEEGYPHSIVEYSPNTGRFSRLFAPWLAGEPAPGEAEHDLAAASEPAAEAAAEPHEEPALEAHIESEPHVEPEPHHEMETAAHEIAAHEVAADETAADETTAPETTGDETTAHEPAVEESPMAPQEPAQASGEPAHAESASNEAHPVALDGPNEAEHAGA